MNMENTITADVSEPLTLDTDAVASISSSAMLVDLTVTQTRMRKNDPEAAARLAAMSGADSEAFTAIKSLFGKKCEELEAVKKQVTKVRNTHKNLTLPWKDGGGRLLTTAMSFSYHKAVTTEIAKGEALVAELVDAYEDRKEEAKMALGPDYNENDYPSIDKFASKFSFSLDVEPLPTSGDFRIDIQNTGIADIAEQYQSKFNDRYAAAMQDVWNRAHKVCQNMSDKLDYFADEDKKIFRDTLVSNVTDIVDMMRGFNITNDPTMTAAANHLEEAMRVVTPDALRENADLRAETKRSVDEVIKTLPSLDLF